MWWNKYLSVPFKDRGRDASGCDCWGLVRLVYAQEKRIALPDYLECYETSNDRDTLAATISSEWQGWIMPDKPEEFDVIVLRMRGVPMHVGIITKRGWMLHCARGVGTAHEPFNNMRWRDKVEGFGRWKSR